MGLVIYVMVGAGVGFFAYEKLPEEIHQNDKGVRIFCGIVLAITYPFLFGYYFAEWLLLEDADK